MLKPFSTSIVRVLLAASFVTPLLRCDIDQRELTVAMPGLQGQGGGFDPGVVPEGGARLAVSVPAVDFGDVTVGFPSRARIALRNEGASVLMAPTVVRSADSSTDFQVIQNQCGAELAVGEACEVRVQFVPSTQGIGRARLDVGSTNGGAGVVTLAGRGLAGGDLILAPAVGSFEDFGSVDIGASLQGRFTLSNPLADSSGPLTFSVNRPEFTLLSPAAADCSPGSSALSNGESCDIGIAFAPSERGLIEATLTATSPAGGSVSLNLSGRGLSAGVLVGSTEAFDFGGVVLLTSGQGALRFENAGDKPLTLGGARLEPLEATQFSILDSDCAEGMALAGAASCGVQLQYRPTDVGVENAAELVVAVLGGEPLRLPLRGNGLQPGALQLLSADATSGPDFGDVLVGQTESRTFTVANPGNQPSGVLSLLATGGFQIVSPPEGNDCVDATTSLATGESCTVRVSVTPEQRQALSGALTISSALAGASSVPLAVRGILDATIEVVSQEDFGRVLTNASAARTITLKNAGDRELPAPTLEITSESPSQQAAFSFESACSTPLAANATCDVVVTWAPVDAVPHSANLRLVSDPGGTATVLLLGQALSPGSLQLSVAEATGPDFGDVPLGTTATRNFVLTNPGNEPSGRITVTSDDNHFLPSLGDCNQGALEGLVDGASCTFSVAFTPDGSDPLVANLSVQSPGAGRTGLEMRGRGRAAATLSATGNRDLGSARIGQPAQPANSFAWTVSNDGDLATGPLQVASSNAVEFQVGADTCAAAALQGHSTCQMTILFAPAEPPGTRQATVSVTDALSGSTATVALTGLAVRLAQPGQSCVNAECAEGECTNGVCCDRACDSTCQVCSAAGVCTDQISQEPCGTGGARCFGVDECKLPAGAACGSSADCGGNLVCKQCTTGGSQCTAPDACCGPCPGSTSCQGGTCGCSAAQLDCGNNLCIPTNRADVCCPVSPDCPQNLPACRGDGQCVQCLDDGDCGNCATCNTSTNTCQNRGFGTACNLGQICNGNGQCITPECTGNGPCQEQCTVCNNFQCVASGPNFNQEVCNQVDDNCDGQINEGGVCNPPPQPEPPPPPPPQEPVLDDCSRAGGILSGNSCCAASCGSCGGEGCGSRPGGASACCGEGVLNTGRICSRDTPPCSMLGPDPSCSTGLVAGSACCTASCGSCAGEGCGSRPGGAASCCGDGVVNAGRPCSDSRPPCVLQ